MNLDSEDITDLVPSDRSTDDTTTAAFKLELASLQEYFRKRLEHIEAPSNRVGCMHDDAGYGLTTEQGLWFSTLMMALEDHFGLNHMQHDGSMDQCTECHEVANCDCITPWKGPYPNGDRRRHGDMAYKLDWKDCPNAHSNQECATRWIASDGADEGSFRWLCDMLNLDYQYIRAKIAEMEAVDLTSRYAVRI